MTYRKRAFTALVAGALALPFLATPAGAAPGDTATPPVQDIAVFCTNPTSPQFSDVGANDTFALAIRCIATAGITVGGPEGRSADQYGPNLNIRRGQMATFIARLLDAADDRDRSNQIQDLPAYDGSNEFTDVPNNFIHVDNINRLADANVVRGGVAGRPATTYSPNELVSRAQMASFINRAAAFAMGQNPDNAGVSTGYSAGSADYFVDDENVQIHEPNINGVASQGIVIGVQPTSERRYNPTGAVTRAQMAGFISRTLSQLFDDNRIFSLLEIFTESFAAADRRDETRVATPDNDGSTAANSRDFTVNQLDPSVDYRVTLVICDNVNRGADDLVTFRQETVNGQRVAVTGNPNSDIVRVNGGAPSNPGSATVTNTAVAKPNSQGVLTFRIEGDTAECVTAVVYINGGQGRSLEDGGTSPRLELDANGRPIEPFGISGDTTFTAPTTQPVEGESTVATEGGSVAPGDSFTATVTASNNQPIDSVTVTGECVDTQTFNAPDNDTTGLAFEVRIAADAELGDCVLTFVTRFKNGTTDSDQVTVNVAEGPQIQEARVATDAAMATDSQIATNTASDGDFFEITFDRVATDSATASSTVTFVDGDGDQFTAQCVANDGDSATASNTAASCFLSDDGRTLRIELLQDPVVDRDDNSNGIAEFPLAIVDTTGITDEQGNDVDLVNSDDVTVERDDDTQDTADPAANSPNSPSTA